MRQLAMQYEEPVQSHQVVVGVASEAPDDVIDSGGTICRDNASRADGTKALSSEESDVVAVSKTVLIMVSRIEQPPSRGSETVEMKARDRRICGCVMVVVVDDKAHDGLRRGKPPTFNEDRPDACF